AVHLGRALARAERGFGRERLRGGRRGRSALVLLRYAPCGPVDERAGELDVGVRLRKRVRDRLVRPDRLPELLARRRVLDAEVEGALRHAERLCRRCGAEARGLSKVAVDIRERASRIDGSDIALGWK